MSETTKKWVNRGGLLAVILGIVLVAIGGGDTGQAVEIAGTVATIAGAALVLLREIFN